MKKQPIIYVIVVTYKGKQWYDKCFSSLQESTIPVHIVVVDNTPGADDANYIREHFPEIHIIKTAENLGFGRANNLGMRYALDHDCDYVFLLNQDTWVECDTVQQLILMAESHSQYGILSPIHMSVGGNRINMELNDGYYNMALLSDLYCNSLKDIYTVQYVNAAAWLLPRKTLETIGGFCPLIFHYGEDDDYINRCRYHGIKIGVVPAAKITHDSDNRVDEAKKLFLKSNREIMDVYLDITRKQSITSFKVYYIRKLIKSLCLFQKSKIEIYWFRYQFLTKHQHAIEAVRKQHTIKQLNWL